jgi:hypothetical protein
MPKTTINKNRNSSASENDIRAYGEVVKADSVIHPKAKTE